MKTTTIGSILPVLLAAALAFPARPAVAADDAAAKREADTLFFEGKRLMKLGKVAAGCFKFEESLGKLEQLGVKLNLADCYEQAGRPASAMRTFREAAEQADKAGDKRVAFARARAEALEGKIGRLVIKAPPGSAVQVDGARIPDGELAAPVPVDPGPHEVVVTVEGVETRQKVTSEAGQPVVVEVPPGKLAAGTGARPLPLVNAGAASAPGRFGDAQPAPASTRKTIAYVVGGAGIAALAAGAVTSVLAVSKKNDAGCADDGKCATQDGVDKLNSARTLGNLATVSFGVGIAAVAAGAILYFTAPRQTEVHASVAQGSGSIWVTKSF